MNKQQKAYLITNNNLKKIEMLKNANGMTASQIINILISKQKKLKLI